MSDTGVGEDNHLYATYPDLDGKAFLVLGTGDGIGRQIVRGLAANGVQVACLDADAAVAARAASLARRGVAIPADVTDPATVAHAFDQAQEAFGRLDAVVDVVGMLRTGRVVDATEQLWQWHAEIVFNHAWRVAAEAGRRLAPGAAVTYVASTAGFVGVRNNAAYAAMKAALISLTRTSAAEFGPLGIRVNAVAPGVVGTPRMHAFLSSAGALAGMQAATPLGRLAEPFEIADALLFLSSGSASYITGQTLVVDGGALSTSPYPDL